MEFKKTLLAVAVTSALFGMAGCSDDDNDNNNNNDEPTNPDENNTPDAASGITDLTDRGAWGGLIVDGQGVVNSAGNNGNAASEAVPDGESRYFGGNNNEDSSGYIRHLIIAESGFAFNPDQEVQGLTLEGVGSGSDHSDGGPFIDYLQVLGSEDDGIEWFGGAAGGKHIVVNGQDDDGLDQDLGWQGNIQYALIRMGSSNGDRAMETDGNGDNFDATPYTAPTIANLTVLGNVGKTDKDTMGHLAREGYRGNIHRAVFIDDTPAGGSFDSGCFGVDEMTDSSYLTDSALTYDDVVCQATNGELAGKNSEFESEFKASGSYDVTVASSANIDNTTLAVNNTGATIDGSLPSGFEDAGYHGAVDPDASSAWWDGWTYKNADVDGNLPGNDFHPLENDIGSTITAADSANCPAGSEASYSADVFGTTFPVCELSSDITSDVELTNDHVYVLTQTVNVGDGGAESGPSGNNDATLTIEGGTMVMGKGGSEDVALVVTRGSKIHVDGTSETPVIMGSWNPSSN